MSSVKFRPLTWFNATIKDGQLWSPLPRGTRILVAESKDKLQLGASWWIFDGKILRQVTRELGGKNLVRVATIGPEHRDQDLCNAKFQPFWLQHRRVLAGLAPEPEPGAKRRARDANGRVGGPAPAQGTKNGPKASKNVSKSTQKSPKGQKQSPKGRKTGVKWGCGEGKSLDGKRSAGIAPRQDPKLSKPNAQKGTIMQQQSNTTKTGKAIVRQTVKVHGEVQTIRFVAGPKRVTVTGKGLPKIIVSGNADEGFTAVCHPNTQKPDLAVTSVAKRADQAFARSVKANWH